MLLPPKYWNYGPVPLCMVLFDTGIEPKALCMPD